MVFFGPFRLSGFYAHFGPWGVFAPNLTVYVPHDPPLSIKILMVLNGGFGVAGQARAPQAAAVQPQQPLGSCPGVGAPSGRSQGGAPKGALLRRRSLGGAPKEALLGGRS